jgi:hypothetical protein
MCVLEKSSRLLNTLKYIKLIQVYFQVLYRIKRLVLKIHWYKKYNNYSIGFVKSVIYKYVILSQGKYLGKNKFKLLNIEYTFKEGIDWKFMGHGKLWNYNLQYFDFLTDDLIPLRERTALIDDFSTKLIAGEIDLEPYPVSLRVVNTLIFISVNNLRNNNVECALKLQVNYLEHNLEYHLLGNHLLENIIALYIASFSISNTNLFKKAERLLIRELNKQILPDGAHYECSVMYHSILTGKLLLCIDIAQHTVHDASIEFLRLKASFMIGWLNAYSFSNGSWALFNDSAEGIAPTTVDLNTSSTFLNIASVSVKMKESGYRKLKNKNTEIIIKAGNIMPDYQPGHTHSDMLSFCLWADGMQCIVDTSISTYNDDTRRHLERSTKAHNTICLDEINQSDIWSSFRIGRRATCRIVRDRYNELIVEHDGYSSLGTIHRRRFSVINNGILVEDYLSNQNKNAELLLHFHHSLKPVLSHDSITFKNVTIYFRYGYHNKSLTLYKQSVGFNKMKTAYKFVASVGQRSSFIITVTEE